MKPVTVWERYSQQRRFEHNHIEDGHVPWGQQRPTPHNEFQKRMWCGETWIKSHAWLDGMTLKDKR